MPELAFVPPLPRAQLMRQVRNRLSDLVPGLRLIGEGMLGADASIDFVGVEPVGRVVAVLVADAGDDLEGIGKAVAQRAWLEPRLRDWIQLAPDLGIRPEAGVRAILLCPDFRPETVAAARALGPDRIGLARFRCVRNGAGIETLVEDISSQPATGRDRDVRADPAATRTTPDDPTQEKGSGEAPAFRTGLRESDLDLSAEERSEFD